MPPTYQCVQPNCGYSTGKDFAAPRTTYRGPLLCPKCGGVLVWDSKAAAQPPLELRNAELEQENKRLRTALDDAVRTLEELSPTAMPPALLRDLVDRFLGGEPKHYLTRLRELKTLERKHDVKFLVDLAKQLLAEHYDLAEHYEHLDVQPFD